MLAASIRNELGPERRVLAQPHGARLAGRAHAHRCTDPGRAVDPCLLSRRPEMPFAYLAASAHDRQSTFDAAGPQSEHEAMADKDPGSPRQRRVPATRAAAEPAPVAAHAIPRDLRRSRGGRRDGSVRARHVRAQAEGAALRDRRSRPTAWRCCTTSASTWAAFSAPFRACPAALRSIPTDGRARPLAPHACRPRSSRCCRSSSRKVRSVRP